MSINIGVFEAPGMPSVRLEISNDKEFIAKVREVNAEAREKGISWPIRRWKIRHLGDRTPAAIQKMIDQSNRTDNAPQLTHEKDDEIGHATAKAMDDVLSEPIDIGTTATKPSEMGHVYEEAESARDEIQGEVQVRAKPKVNPFTGEPQS
jgi:hypothetical protein